MRCVKDTVHEKSTYAGGEGYTNERENSAVSSRMNLETTTRMNLFFSTVQVVFLDKTS